MKHGRLTKQPAADRRGNVVVRSVIAASPERVWARISTPAGINHELMPLMRMTVPRRAGSLDLDTLPVGEPIGRSWVLLFGLLPFDYDDLCIVELEPGRRFLEHSRMLHMRSWQHERTVELVSGGSLVTDRLTFVPRVPIAGRHLEPVVRAIFRHRHRRLRAWFG